jgi:fucose permease
MIGPLMPSLLGAYSLRLAGGGLVESFRSIGGMAAALLAGGLSDRYPKAVLVAALFAGYGITLFLIGLAPSYVLLLAVFFILGAATRLVDSISNALTADLFPRSSGPALNTLHTVFGVGALIGPIFARAVLLRSGEWQRAYGLLALLCLLVLALFVWLQLQLLGVLRARRGTGGRGADAPHSAEPTGTDHRESPLRLLRYGRMWLVSGMMFFYVAHQAGMSVWLPTFLSTELEAGMDLAAASTALLWSGIVAGRIAMIRVSRSIPARWILVSGGLLSGALLGLAYWSGSGLWISAASFIAGVATGAVIPLLVALACSWVPRHSGSASALVFFNASLSRMITPWLIGALAGTIPFVHAMSLTWVPLLAVGLLASFIPRD